MATKPKLPPRKTQAPAKPIAAPIAAVRNPNFDAAMAQQNYQNLLSDAQANNFTQGRLMGAPTQQDNRKPMYFSAMEAELQKQFMDQNPQLRPPAGRAFDPEILSRNNVEFEKYRMGLNQKYYNDVGQFIPEDQKKYSYPQFLESVVDPSKVSPKMAENLARLRSEYNKINPIPTGAITPPPVAPVLGGQQSTNSTAGYAQVDPMTGMQGNQSIYDSLRDYQARTYPVPMGGNPTGIGQQFGQIPQQQMQNYQNFLQQGMQNRNMLNQDAAANFANMQAGSKNQNIPTSNLANTYSTMKPYAASTDQGMQQFKMQQQAKSSQFAQGIPKFSF